MLNCSTRDIDFTAARLHGRRSELADGARLDELCRIRTVAELCRKLNHDCGPAATAADFQRKILADYARDLSDLAAGVPVEYADFFEWQRSRFQLENAKVVIRGIMAKRKAVEINAHLINFAIPVDFDPGEKFTTEPWRIFSCLEVDEAITRSVAEMAEVYTRYPYIFTLESAMDRAYYAELVSRAAKCRDEEGGVVQTARQEAAMFMTMLALRGGANYGIGAEVIEKFFIEGTALSHSSFTKLITAKSGEIESVIGGIAVDSLPSEPEIADVEAACWNRYLRLANRLFRRGHMNVAAIAGFIGLRRIEVANLITLSEGLRLGMNDKEIRPRLIPR